jgi:tripartite ATP-independent transporter DctP family solute receptor
MKLTRRALLASSAATSVALACPSLVRAAEPEFTYKFGVDLPGTHPTATWMQKAADRIKTETNGRLLIQVFPNSALGSSTDMISQVRAGAMEFHAQSGPGLSQLVPTAGLNSMGFAFRNEEEVWRAMDGELGAYIRGQIAKTNLVPFDAMWGHGFRHMTSSTGPITSPADMSGVKVRVPPGLIFVSLFRALGASPATINFNELYSALQTKIIDAQENPLALLLSGKLYEVQKFVSLTGHMWAGYWFLANRRAWEALPADLRDVVSRVVNESAKGQRAELAEQEAAYERDLLGKGMMINRVDTAPFRESLAKAGYYREWQGKFGEEAWALLEKFAGRLA